MPWAISAVLVLGAAAQAQNARIVLRWKDVPGASAYELQIAKDAAFVEVVLQTRTTVAAYKWEQLPSVTHWWRVRSFDAEIRPSEWSAPRTIAVDSAIPTPKLPADGAALPCGAGVTFELEPSPLVKEYLVELAGGADFASFRTVRGAGPSLEVAPLPSGAWWWRTRAVDIKGRTSGPGPVRTFAVKVASPRPKAVADVPLGTKEVTLAWSPVGCAKSYLVEATVDGKDRVSIPSAEPATVFKAGVAGEYRWKVASVDERGAPGEYSGESVFRVKLPAPQVKADVTAAGQLVAQWAAVPTASGYRLELLLLGGKAPKAIASATVTAPGWRSAELEPGSYTLRVTARDALGHTSVTERKVERPAGAPLPTPVVLGPEPDAAIEPGTELEVRWAWVADATRYELEVDGVALAPTEASALKTAALAEGEHFLRLRALGLGGRVSEWTAPREVYAGVPPVARAEVELVGEAVRVRLIDRKERPVADAAPRLSVRDGRLGPAEAKDGAWVASWSPPVSGRDVLVVEERGFRQEFPLVAPVDAFFSVAARAGGIFSGGAVASPTGHVAVTARLPWLQRRLGGELRVGLYGAASALPVGGVTLDGRATLLPVSLLLAWHQTVGPVQLKGGVGPAVQLAWLRVGADAEFRAAPGVEVAVGVSRKLGPGRVEVDVAFLYSRLETALARLNAGGVGVRVGYAFDFGGGL